MRTTTAARSGSVLIAVQGAASCRYSLPSTHSAAQRLGGLAHLDRLELRGQVGELRADVGVELLLQRPGLAARRDHALEPRLAELEDAVDEVAEHVGQVAVHRATGTCSQVKAVSELSGLLAVRYQRQ